MDRNRIVTGLDVHKDSIYLCIMNYDGAIIFEKTYGVLTPQLRKMCEDMVMYGGTGSSNGEYGRILDSRVEGAG